MNILCRLGLHHRHRPWKGQGGHGYQVICKWCGWGQALYTGKWEFKPGAFAHYDELGYPAKLAKSTAFAMLPSSTPWETQVRIVGGMGHDVAKELADIERTNAFLRNE